VEVEEEEEEEEDLLAEPSPMEEEEHGVVGGRDPRHAQPASPLAYADWGSSTHCTSRESTDRSVETPDTEGDSFSGARMSGFHHCQSEDVGRCGGGAGTGCCTCPGALWRRPLASEAEVRPSILERFGTRARNVFGGGARGECPKLPLRFESWPFALHIARRVSFLQPSWAALMTSMATRMSLHGNPLSLRVEGGAGIGVETEVALMVACILYRQARGRIKKANRQTSVQFACAQGACMQR